MKLSVNGISGGLNKARLKLRDVLVMEEKKKVQGSRERLAGDILIQTGNTGEAGGRVGREVSGDSVGIEQKHKEMASLEVETFTVTFSERGCMNKYA